MTSLPVFRDIVAKEMGDIVSVAIYDGENLASVEFSDSVRGYVQRGIDNGAFDNPNNKELAQLLVALLNYGSEAQKALGYEDRKSTL